MSTAAAGDELAAAALALAAAGLPVLPCHEVVDGRCSCDKAAVCASPGKHPCIAGGLTRASSDVAAVAAWWQRWPHANIAIRTGAEAGVLVLDVDTPKGGAGALAKLEREHGELPRTVKVLTGSGGAHFWFRHPGREVRNSASRLGVGLDVRGDGGYVVVPPSVHASGRPYKWLHAFAAERLAESPAWLLEDVARRTNGRAEPVEDVIPQGRRRDVLLSLAGTMRRRGMKASEIRAALDAVNAARCRPPLEPAELDTLASDVAERWQPDEASAIPSVKQAEAQAVDDVLATFKRWLYLPDERAVLAVLGAVAANHLEGAPVWLLLVGPPSSGKSELLSGLTRLPDVHAAAVLSEASLLSGSPARERAAGAKGGLLRELGDFGCIVAKDFGSVLSMRHDARTPVLAALREVYDGSWTRHVGTDGGRTLHWQGKAGLVAGCTQSIDRHYAVVSAMGDRFVLFRMPQTEAREQARTALKHAARGEKRMHEELGAAVAGLFANGLPRKSRPLSDAERERLVTLAELVARARSGVERDSYSREVELVPDAEAPGRLAKALERLLAGLDALAVERETAWSVVEKTALDSMPALRLLVLRAVLAKSAPEKTRDIATAVRYPTQTTRRALEDLTAHAVLARYPQGPGKADLWAASEWLRGCWHEAALELEPLSARDAESQPFGEAE